MHVVRSAFAPPAHDIWFGNLVLVSFLLTQVLDGTFTYIGISVLGFPEGNPLLAYYMSQMGVGPSLTFAKILAAACAMMLHLLGLHRTLAALTLLYLSLAILPWTILILFAR